MGDDHHRTGFLVSRSESYPDAIGAVPLHLDLDVAIALAGLFVGFTVGLTGMGGGALMTPILVLLFHVQPLAAVSSDLVAAVVMKPVGGAVHLRRGTVNFALVRWAHGRVGPGGVRGRAGAPAAR